MSQNNEFIGIVFGILLLICMHIIAIIAIIALGYILFYRSTGYAILVFWGYAVAGCSLIQLVYVIPVVLRLKRQQRWGMMKGVIFGAVVTALLNGGCFVLLFLNSR